MQANVEVIKSRMEEPWTYTDQFIFQNPLVK